MRQILRDLLSLGQDLGAADKTVAGIDGKRLLALGAALLLLSFSEKSGNGGEAGAGLLGNDFLRVSRHPHMQDFFFRFR